VSSGTAVALEKNVSNNNEAELDVRPVKGTRDFYPADMRHGKYHRMKITELFKIRQQAPIL
jgi:hypothetical protein